MAKNKIESTAVTYSLSLLLIALILLMVVLLLHVYPTKMTLQEFNQ